MTVANWCILIAALLPYFTTSISKWGRKDFDNHNPRAWQQKLSGYRARADAAHRNHLEVLPIFGLSVLMAQQAAAPQYTINLIAMLFVVLRILYTWLYVANQASMRSLCWAFSIILCIALFIVTAVSAGVHPL